jgi:Ca-activated chloride channel family protein
MFNRSAYHNTRPGGVSVLEVAGLEEAPKEQRFVPLRRTELRGEIVGPLACLTLVHTYGYSREVCDQVLQALYRFPLPGDAAVTGVRVRFGDVEIRTELKPREQAEAEYDEAVEEGRQAALLTRESPNVFTLRVAGIRPDEDVVIETDYVQLARPQTDQAGWLLRVPLTTAPRYVREDELASRHARGQPLALLRDPGHRFALDLRLRDADGVRNPTHKLDVEPSEEPDSRRISLREGEVLPDRDFVLSWTPRQAEAHPTLSVHLHDDGDHVTFLALVAPPATHWAGTGPAREIVLLVDHSGSMGGAKWEAADWAVNSFLGRLTERDYFALGLFHDSTKWFKQKPVRATPANLRAAAEYLDKNRDSGGTNLGVALEQALQLKRRQEAGDLARHVLVVTDAQVSDAARLFRLADREAEREDRRRISILCIDAAPNSFLANELSERGGGVTYFLTSNPAEEDISTALEDVLADWAEPVLIDLRLTVDRAGGQATGRQVSLEGDETVVDLGNLPHGRALWVAGRVPSDAQGKPHPQALTFALRTPRETVATAQVDPMEAGAGLSALKALFGACRLLTLEHLTAARYPPEQLRVELARMGYDADVILGAGQTVYAENALKAAYEALTPLLIEESLRYGIACSETGFIAVREEAGERVGATAVVANALPAGWSDDFATLPAGRSIDLAIPAFLRRPGHQARALAPAMSLGPPGLGAGKGAAFLRSRAGRGREEVGRSVTLFSGVPAFTHGEAELFDSREDGKLPDEATLRRLSVQFEGRPPKKLGRGLKLLVYVGDLDMPRATVRLADLLRAGGERPLNLRRSRGEIVRIVLHDPDGAWAAGAPRMTVSVAI